jgi:preprotein translocase subunit SecE
MAKNEAIAGVWTSLLSPAIYKRTQGKRVRQLTAGLLIGWSAFGCFTLYNGPLVDSHPQVRIGFPTALVVLAGWFAFRLVNVPTFADFLIAVEAEMRKISWPTLQQCIRAATVVILTMFMLAIVLFGYDQFWMRFFSLIKVLRI